MVILKGKHIIAELDGVRCTVVETGASEARAEFLKEILSFNRYEVKVEKEKAKDGSLLDTFVIGVTDILFNPMIAVYQKKLFRKDKKTVTPEYWYQKAGQDDIPYWQVQP
jgi:hypothetical protein